MEPSQALFTLPEGLTQEELDIDPTDIKSFRNVEDYLAFVCLQSQENKSPENDDMFTCSSQTTKHETSIPVKITTVQEEDPETKIARKLNLSPAEITRINDLIAISIQHISFLKSNVSVQDSLIFKNPNLDLAIAHMSVPEIVKFFDSLAETLEYDCLMEGSDQAQNLNKLLGQKIHKKIFYTLIRILCIENFVAEDSVIASSRRIAKILHNLRSSYFENSEAQDSTGLLESDTPVLRLALGSFLPKIYQNFT